MILSFQSFIHESFNTKPVQWRIKNFYHYWFQIEDFIYDVEFKKLDFNLVEVSFTIDLGQGTTKIVSLSDTGHQYEVLATVIDIWKNFQENRPEITNYIFAASLGQTNARVKVYERLLKKFLPKEWMFTKKDFEVSNDNKGIVFKITKK
jgi:hypothetical protein